jgi:hypothetical protein
VSICFISAAERHAQGEEGDAAVVEFAEHGMGGDLLIHDQHAEIVAGQGFPVVAERDHLARLAGFGNVGVGVDQVVGAGVLGEEGKHGAGSLGAGGHVVLLQGGVVALVSCDSVWFT